MSSLSEMLTSHGRERRDDRGMKEKKEKRKQKERAKKKGRV